MPLALATALVSAADLPVTVTVNPAAGRAAISPYIYGSNQDFSGVALTARRIGGNRMTGDRAETDSRDITGKTTLPTPGRTIFFRVTIT